MGDNSNKIGPKKQNGNGKLKYHSHVLEKLSAARQRQFIHIRQLVDGLPELRMDRISKLEKAIEAGEYHVSSMKIAEAIMQKSIRSSPLW
jgi:anti-sigma28 factor (negative regulator of flagellin synthesis)